MHVVCVVTIECIDGTSVAPALRGGVGGHGPMPPLQSLPRWQCQQDPGPSTPCHQSVSHPRARLSGLLNPQVETADGVGAKVNAEARKRPPTISTLLGGGAAPREVARPLGGWGQGGPEGRGGLPGLGSGGETAPGRPQSPDRPSPLVRVPTSPRLPGEVRPAPPPSPRADIPAERRGFAQSLKARCSAVESVLTADGPQHSQVYDFRFHISSACKITLETVQPLIMIIIFKRYNMIKYTNYDT